MLGYIYQIQFEYYRFAPKTKKVWEQQSWSFLINGAFSWNRKFLCYLLEN